jgi:acyl-coenzyme A synthetase/AMP-(fatty) acid ligase
MTSRLSWLYHAFEERPPHAMMIHEGRTFSYAWLLEEIAAWDKSWNANGVASGTVVALRGDYTPRAIAALLSLIDLGAIVVPLSPSVAAQEAEFLEIAEVQVAVMPNAQGATRFESFSRRPSNELTLSLIRENAPGLVLFSSGSTGKSKAALHDFHRLLEKFRKPRRPMVTLTFLMIDHIGGINTLLSVLSSGGTVICSHDRDPDRICAVIERHKVELLPASPTFLNLLLISEAYRRHDLASLQLITYGTELMPQTTLNRIREICPHARIQQTYGLSELGILRAKSQSSDSLWVKVGGEGFETKVEDGTLRIRARSAMLGYLNAPSPFDAEGWFDTQDMVETDGEYVRFLGRRSEIINVGGKKVYPAEVENILLQISNVKDATVTGEANPITGSIVVARVNLLAEEDSAVLKRRIREFCRARLESFKVPAKIEVVNQEQFSNRYKKMRRALNT